MTTHPRAPSFWRLRTLTEATHWFDIDREEGVALGVLDKDGGPFTNDTLVKVQQRPLDEHFKERLERALKQFISLDPLGESMG